MTKWTAVVGYKCAHGHTIPMQGVSRSGEQWYGLFCPAGECRPSWRNPNDPWLVLGATVTAAETERRMANVARALTKVC